MNTQDPWFSHGSITAEHEDYLIGNRAGLEALSCAITRALETGEAPILPEGLAIARVRVEATRPVRPQKTGGRGALIVLGLIVLMLAVLFITMLGIDELAGFLRKFFK